MKKIGFIGLGNMGLPMAKNLVTADYQVTGFDLSDAAMNALKKAGGQIAQDIKAAVTDAQIVLTMLPSGAQVQEIYCG
ncbi:MAG: NAD(P)-binding domain-containing protein, partial [Parvibaculales bacterium]